MPRFLVLCRTEYLEVLLDINRETMIPNIVLVNVRVVSLLKPLKQNKKL